MRDLVNDIVEKMTKGLGAAAASLYLVDEREKLVIQAGTGYQRPLVAKGTEYGIGEGVTGWIAKNNEKFRADTLEELNKHPNYKGKHTHQQEGQREPKSFLGLPLRVVDRDSEREKVIGVLES